MFPSYSAKSSTTHCNLFPASKTTTVGSVGKPSVFIRGNQVIRLQSAEGGVVMTSLHVQAKYRRHDAWLNKHKNETKHVYIRLELLSSTYLSVKPIQMDTFRQQIP